MKKLIFIILLFLFIPFAVFAEVEEVIVEGEGVEQPEAAHTTGSVTVIDTTSAAGKVSDVADALEESPGLSIKRYGGLGSYSAVSIRGTGSNQATIFIDGVPLYGGAAGVVNLSNLPLDSLERIEVYRGVAPLGFGGAPIGGVVNLVTRKASSGANAGSAASYGSFGTYKLDLFESANVENRNMLFFYTHTASDGDFEYLDDNGTPFNDGDDKVVTRKNNQFVSDNFLVKSGVQILDGLNIFVADEFFRKVAGVPGFSTLRIEKASLSSMRNSGYAGAQYSSGDLSIDTLAFYTYIEEEYRDPLGEVGLAARDNLYVTRTYGLNATGKYFFGDRAMASVFGEGKKETYNEYDLINDSAWPRSECASYSAAAQGEFYFFASRLILVPTIRAEYYKNDFAGISSATHGVIGEKNADSETQYSPHFGLRIKPIEPLSIYANVGQYYRVPGFVELFGDRGNMIGNPGLEPEKGLHADLGVEFAYGDYRWLDSAKIIYTIYYLDVEDIIIVTQNSQRTAIAQNVSEAQILGHEFAVHATFANFLKTDVVYTFQQTRDNSGISYIDGNPLPGRPQNELRIRAAAFREKIGEVFYSFDYMDGNFLDRAGYVETPARKIHGAGLTLTPSEGLSMTFEAKNIGDDRIADVLGYPLPGRSYFATVKYEYNFDE